MAYKLPVNMTPQDMAAEVKRLESKPMTAPQMKRRRHLLDVMESLREGAAQLSAVIEIEDASNPAAIVAAIKPAIRALAEKAWERHPNNPKNAEFEAAHADYSPAAMHSIRRERHAMATHCDRCDWPGNTVDPVTHVCRHCNKLTGEELPAPRRERYQGAMLDFTTDAQSLLPRLPLSTLKTGEFFLMRTNQPGEAACYTKFVVQADGTALTVARSATQRERKRFGDPRTWTFVIADEATRNPDVDGKYGVFVCDEAFGNRNRTAISHVRLCPANDGGECRCGELRTVGLADAPTAPEPAKLPTYSGVPGDDRCECADVNDGHPHIVGDTRCTNRASVTLFRVDMTDVTETRFCDSCGDDALDCGLFSTL